MFTAFQFLFYVLAHKVEQHTNPTEEDNPDQIPFLLLLQFLCDFRRQIFRLMTVRELIFVLKGDRINVFRAMESSLWQAKC